MYCFACGIEGDEKRICRMRYHGEDREICTDCMNVYLDFLAELRTPDLNDFVGLSYNETWTPKLA